MLGLQGVARTRRYGEPTGTRRPVEGLFWLTVVGLVLFLATVAYGAVRQRARGPRV